MRIVQTIRDKVVSCLQGRVQVLPNKIEGPILVKHGRTSRVKTCAFYLLWSQLLLVLAHGPRKGAESLEVVLWQVVPATGALVALLLAHRASNARPDWQWLQPRLGGVLLVSGLFFGLFGNLAYGVDPWLLLPWRLLSVPLLAFYLLPPSPERGSRLPWLYGPARRGIFVALVGLAIGLRVAALQMSPAPLIDVWYFTNLGAEGILSGINPYDRAYPVVDPRSETLYAYLPGQFVFDLPSRVLLGDMRAGQVLLELASAAMLFALVRGGKRVSTKATRAGEAEGLAENAPTDTPERAANPSEKGRRLAAESVALLLLYFPQSLFSQEQAWVEFKQVFAITLFAWLSVQHQEGWRSKAPWALGLLFSLKQTAWPAAAFLLRLPRPHLSRWIKLTSTMGLLILPFVLWSPTAFYQDIVAYHVGLPLPHSPSLTWTLFLLTGWTLPLVGLGLVGASVWGLLLWDQRQRLEQMSSQSPGERLLSFVMASAVLSAVPVLMRQAYINYYYYIVGLVLVGLALSLRDDLHAAPQTSAEKEQA